jgi:hypothetical protein
LGKEYVVRVLIAFMLLAPLAFAQGCATQDRAARAAEQAALAESEDDAFCRERGAPDSEAYQACRQSRADARAKAAAAQEQRRRDFDRTLGAGTDGQAGF